MARPKKYPDELVERGVRLALESERPIAHIAADLGMHPEALRKRVRQAEADSGARPELLSSQEREEIRRLRRENYELRRANEILKSASVFSPRSSTQTVRSDRVHRRASRPFRGRADLPDLGRVGVRLLSAPAASARDERSRTNGCWSASVSCTRPTISPTDRGGCGLRWTGPAGRSAAVASSG
jgi:transposase